MPPKGRRPAKKPKHDLNDPGSKSDNTTIPQDLDTAQGIDDAHKDVKKSNKRPAGDDDGNTTEEDEIPTTSLRPVGLAPAAEITPMHGYSDANFDLTFGAQPLTFDLMQGAQALPHPAGYDTFIYPYDQGSSDAHFHLTNFAQMNAFGQQMPVAPSRVAYVTREGEHMTDKDDEIARLRGENERLKRENAELMRKVQAAMRVLNGAGEGVSGQRGM